MQNIFIQLAIILSLASLLGFIVRKLKLPLLVAYLLVGMVLSSVSLLDLKHSPVFILPEIGTAFVLFLIGMELDLREVRALGKPILIVGLLQILISALAGYSISSLFGFPGMQAFYIGVGLSFSSTIVVIKLLLERKDLNSLYGKLSLGVLLLEDLIAVLVLMFISVGSSAFNLGLQSSFPIIALILKGLSLIIGGYLLSRFVLPKIFTVIAKSSELLFLTAIAWCFVFTSIALLLGFSLVIGAFLAGVALASSPFHYHISGKIRPLRDFFLILFFVYLGAQSQLQAVAAHITLIAIFVAFALIVKPLIYLLLFGAFGFKRHTIFQASLNLSQISEFSLIILLVGVQFGIVDQSALSIMAMTTIITITLSSILISRSKKIYPIVKPLLNFFEVSGKFHDQEQREDHDLSDHVVVIGAHRIGGPIVDFLKKEEIPFIVLDFNPEIVKKLLKQKIKVIYGDLGDEDVLDTIKTPVAKLVISTSSNLDDNKALIAYLKRKRSESKVIVRASEHDDVDDLKKLGADYVIFPEDVSADFLVTQLKTHWPRIYIKENP